MIEFYFFETHAIWHFHVSQLLLIIKWWRSLLTHPTHNNIGVNTILALTLLWTFYSICKTRAIFFITFCFFTCAKFSLCLFSPSRIFIVFHRLSPFFWIYFIFAILALTKRCANPIVIKTFTIWFQALSVFAVAKLTSICH